MSRAPTTAQAKVAFDRNQKRRAQQSEGAICDDCYRA
jgi:hypothetical protein